jgi:hypothetical protein
MNGDDLERRIGRLRMDAKALSRFALLQRGRPTATSTTAADCARNARDPLRRLEPLRRRSGEATTQPSASIH